MKFFEEDDRPKNSFARITTYNQIQFWKYCFVLRNKPINFFLTYNKFTL